jgi:hypothetical protein
LHIGPLNVPPSSNPGEIFERLRAATIERTDWHEPYIPGWKLKIQELAINWQRDGRITNEEQEEIMLLLERADIGQWRPLIYIIRRELVESRLIRVHLRDRASLEMEYKIEDLQPHEFDVIGP